MFIEYLMVLIVCGCKCKDFFIISNTFSQLFSEPNSLISKDIKLFLEARFSGVKYRYNDSFHAADSGMCLKELRIRISGNPSDCILHTILKSLLINVDTIREYYLY